jgi:DNA-binding transcriptional regulator YiaG
MAGTMKYRRPFSMTAEEMREWKVATRLSYDALAYFLGVDESTVKAWCKGRRRPSLGMTIHIRVTLAEHVVH